MRSTDADDNKRHFFRSQERLFCFNGQWYFATREGDNGPFPTKDIARAEVARYISERAALRGFQESRFQESRKKEEAKNSGRAVDLGLTLVPMD